jgi:predicted NBD/HSP70 family sugar kinase
MISINSLPFDLPLDPAFCPASLWTEHYLRQVNATPGAREVTLAIAAPGGTVTHHRTRLMPGGPADADNLLHLERTLKFLLWQRGGSKVYLSGADPEAARLRALYAPQGERAFDHAFFSEKIYREPLEIHAVSKTDLPPGSENPVSLGGHLNGYRIGFDLGGSDRKCAAVVDGEVVFSEEIRWDPYFQTDPDYHIAGIRDSLRRAAAHLPRVDAIGGSSAGVYIQNQVRASSLFRGIAPAEFDAKIRNLFADLRREWNDIPFEVVNDGEVTALAGSQSLKTGALLGISMGTSLAAGYCDPGGRITPHLNELAFAPIDYRRDAPADEWSGDRGCGVQYFSQQAVARLAQNAGYLFAADTPFADRLLHIQEEMAAGKPAAREIYRTIGVCFGYALAHYAGFYELRHVLLLGRVSSGEGGQCILDHAQQVLQKEFQGRHAHILLSMPDEHLKRHGQAIAAASLPFLPGDTP